MGIATELCKAIGREIDNIPVTVFEDVEIEYIPRVDIDIETCLDQPVDVHEGGDGNLSPRQVDIDWNLLGSYTCMHSPGVVSLYKENISRFFWRIVRLAIDDYRVRSLTRIDLKNLLSIVVHKTYCHEVFHFNCDVFRRLFGFRFNPLLEEALAVSYSHYILSRLREDGKTFVGRSYAVLYNIFMRDGFNYISPGYRDWRNFEGYSRLSAGLVDYIKPGDFVFLRGNGVNLDDIIFGMMRSGQGPYHECII